MNQQTKQKYEKAKQIAEQAIEYAKTIIKPDMPLLDIAEMLESKIIELEGKPAFPVNLSINDIAAHYTPTHDDKTKVSGLLKVDLGVHIDGYICDTAFSLDLENNDENTRLIESAEQALKSAVTIAKKSATLSKIGEAIQSSITSKGFTPITNLSGHELKQYQVHAGLTIPNHNNNSTVQLHEGAYAIEPFSTTGQGLVYEGKPSTIYKLEQRKAIRDSLARQILDFIEQEYSTLPFCSRWLVKKFSPRVLFSLALLEKQGILHQFPQLIEKSHKKVAQAETTILIE